MKKKLFAGTFLLVSAATVAPVSAITVDFNTPFPAPFTFACINPTDDGIPCYTEDGMTFKPTVYNHYHLSPEDPDLLTQINFPFTEIPDDTPRLIQPHRNDEIIRMTYDPEGDGVLNSFDLMSFDLRGVVTLRGSNDATASFSTVGPSDPLNPFDQMNQSSGSNASLSTESLLTQLVDASFEGLNFLDFRAGSVFSIDNVVFEPSDSSSTSTAVPEPSSFFGVGLLGCIFLRRLKG